MSSTPFKVTVLISGSGRTLANLLDWMQDGRLPIQIVRVISSHAGVLGLKIAEEHGIPATVCRPGDYPDEAAYSDAIFQLCREDQVQLVAMAGFIRYVPIPADFENRVTNIHPGLIPAFCGKGYYGNHVHQAVLDYGAKISGCTIHFVDNQYDHGPIIAQHVVPVRDDDTASSLAARVFEAECQAYPESLRQIAQGRIQVEGRRVRRL